MTSRRFFTVLWLIAGLVGLYIVVSAVITRQSTGLLTVTTPGKTTSISVSQLKSQAQIIGVGGAKIRLYPGTYQVSANNGTRQTTVLVTISKQHTATLNLNPTKKSKLPSVTGILFSGTGALTDSGLTAGQLQNLKEAFFAFSPSASKIAVSPDSVSPGPRDISSPSPIFSMDFRVEIDAASYSAKITYGISDAVKLFLYDNHGGQVFDSNSVPTS